MESKDHQNMGSFNPRIMIGRIYIGDHYKLLHTKYISCGPYGFKLDFINFSHYKSIET